METVYRTAYVFVRDDFAGILCETDSGYSFTYDAEYLEKSDSTSVSLTLAVKESNT